MGRPGAHLALLLVTWPYYCRGSAADQGKTQGETQQAHSRREQAWVPVGDLGIPSPHKGSFCYGKGLKQTFRWNRPPLDLLQGGV